VGTYVIRTVTLTHMTSHDVTCDDPAIIVVRAFDIFVHTASPCCCCRIWNPTDDKVT